MVKKNNEVREALKKLDVDLVGVVALKDIKGTQLAEDALKLLPVAKSIVALGMEIFPEFLDLTKPEMTMGTPNLNDLLVRHKDYLRGRLNKAAYDIALASHEEGLKALPLPGYGPAVDRRFLEAVISYKEAAVAAGLFVWSLIGSDEMELVRPRRGPPPSALAAAEGTETTAEPRWPSAAAEEGEPDDEPGAAVEVAAVDFGSHSGSVFYVSTGPEHAATTTAVVWVTDDVTGDAP